jgi:hypothetical protein
MRVRFRSARVCANGAARSITVYSGVVNAQLPRVPAAAQQFLRRSLSRVTAHRSSNRVDLPNPSKRYTSMAVRLGPADCADSRAAVPAGERVTSRVPPNRSRLLRHSRPSRVLDSAVAERTRSRGCPSSSLSVSKSKHPPSSWPNPRRRCVRASVAVLECFFRVATRDRGQESRTDR